MKLFRKPAKISRQYVIRLALFFVAAFIVVVYFTYSPRVNNKFYSVQVLFKPVKCSEYTQEWQGRKAQEVQFKNKNGISLYGLYFPSPEATRTILVHHGSMATSTITYSIWIFFCDLKTQSLFMIILVLERVKVRRQSKA